MGNDYEGQEKAIQELLCMSAGAREFLMHHLRNSLHTAAGYVVLAQMKTHEPNIYEFLNESADSLEHALKDLRKIGC